MADSSADLSEFLTIAHPPGRRRVQPEDRAQGAPSRRHRAYCTLWPLTIGFGRTSHRVWREIQACEAGGAGAMGNGQAVRKVKAFVSSPGDVAVERARIDLVARRLNEAFAGLVEIETIRWERKFYSSHAGFQDQIPPAAGSDLVIAIFWSRLGTPLPESFARMAGGERYPSGTAYEVLTAIEERKKGDRPDVYVFRKTETFAGATDQAKAQW